MISILSSIYLKVVALTSRISVHYADQQSKSILEEKRAAVFVYWQEHVYFLMYFLGIRRFWILMNPRQKADHLSQCVSLCGGRLLSSSSEAGGRHNIVVLIEQLKQGAQVATAADGSRGPQGQCRAGALIMAQESKTPLVPISWSAKGAFTFRLGGNQILIPLPFNTIEVWIGSPITVLKHYRFDDLDGIKNRLTMQLNKLKQSP